MTPNDVLNIASAALFVTLVALGLMIIFGILRVINMAHGEFVMLGAFTAYFVTSHDVTFWVALLVAPLVVGLMGVVIERVVVRPLYRRHDLSTLLATWGLSLVLQQSVQAGFGAQPRSVTSPLKGSTDVLGTTYPSYRLIAMAVSLFVIVSIIVLFFRTDFGLAARATIHSPEIAGALGINTGRMFMLAFGFGAALTGFAGALMAPFIGIVPTMGLPFAVDSFLTVIVGGLGQIFGAVGGGVLIGGGKNGFSIAVSPTVAQILILLLAVVVMLVRPRGLFHR